MFFSGVACQGPCSLIDATPLSPMGPPEIRRRTAESHLANRLLSSSGQYFEFGTACQHVVYGGEVAVGSDSL